MFSDASITGPVALYVRVSTDEQALRDTPRIQHEELARWVDYRGVTVFKTYTDDLTGKLPLHEREGGAALLNDARAGRFSHVVVYKLDRAARSLRVLLEIKDSLAALGVGLVSVKENINTEDYFGRLMFNVLGAIAEWEIETTKLRSDHGRKKAAEAGRFIGNAIPLGFQLDEHRHLIPYPPDLPILRTIWKLYADKHGMGDIAETLNSRGEGWYRPVKRQPKGTLEPYIQRRVAWDTRSVRQVLRMPYYRGEVVWQTLKGEEPAWEVPALLEPGLVSKVDRQINERSFRRDQTPALLSGILRCGLCGSAFHASVRNTTNNGKTYTYTYYKCAGQRSWRSLGLTSYCRAKLIPREPVEREVWAHIEQWAKNPEEFESHVASGAASPNGLINELTQKQSSIQGELEGISQQKQDLLALYGKSLINEHDLETRLEVIGVEESEVRSRLNTTQQALVSIHGGVTERQDAVEWIYALNQKMAAGVLDSVNRREVVRGLLARAVVMTTDTGKRRKSADIRLVWRFLPPDEAEARVVVSER